MYSKLYMFVILSLVIATNQPPQGSWFSWMPGTFLASWFFSGTNLAPPTQSSNPSVLTVPPGGQQPTIIDLQRQRTETRAAYEGQVAAIRDQLALAQRENSELYQRIGALRQNTKECLAIVVAMFDKTKSQDYVAGLLAGFMSRLSTEEQRIFAEIQEKIDSLAAEKNRITTEIESLKKQTSEEASRLSQKKEAAVLRIQQEIDRLTKEKEQQEREANERNLQIQGLQRKLLESSFYHQVAKNQLNSQLTREGLIHMAYRWMVEEAARKTGDMTAIMFELNPFDGNAVKNKNTFLEMLQKHTSREALQQDLSTEVYTLLMNNFALNQCVALLRVQIDAQASISATEIRKALNNETLVCRGTTQSQALASIRQL